MLVVGLSGGIASGKSAVSAVLSSLSIPLIDLDVLARQAVEPGSRALLAIQNHFGADVIMSDGSLDRLKLGDIIFRDSKQRTVLNAIVHPAVRRLMARSLVRYWLSGHRICVVDAPLLIEAGLWRWCGCIVLVYCSERLQLERLTKRNNLSTADAHSRIGAQMPLSSKLTYADHVIDNSGTLGELRSQVESVVAKIEHEAGWTWFLSWIIPPYGILMGVLTMIYRLYIKGVGQSKRRNRSDAPDFKQQ